MTPFKYIDVLQMNDNCTDVDWDATDAAIDAHFETDHDHLTEAALAEQRNLSKQATRAAWGRLVDAQGHDVAVMLLAKFACLD